jgi:hypothetical protein
LRGKILSGKELIRLANKIPRLSSRAKQEIRDFLKTFYALNTFGQNFYV